jgi:hypothetical protein
MWWWAESRGKSQEAFLPIRSRTSAGALLSSHLSRSSLVPRGCSGAAARTAIMGSGGWTLNWGNVVIDPGLPLFGWGFFDPPGGKSPVLVWTIQPGPPTPHPSPCCLYVNVGGRSMRASVHGKSSL